MGAKFEWDSNQQFCSITDPVKSRSVRFIVARAPKRLLSSNFTFMKPTIRIARILLWKDDNEISCTDAPEADDDDVFSTYGDIKQYVPASVHS